MNSLYIQIGELLLWLQHKGENKLTDANYEYVVWQTHTTVTTLMLQRSTGFFNIFFFNDA